MWNTVSSPPRRGLLYKNDCVCDSVLGTSNASQMQLKNVCQIGGVFFNKINTYSAVIDFSLQILTTKVDPHTVKVKNICNGRISISSVLSFEAGCRLNSRLFCCFGLQLFDKLFLF